MKFSPHLLQVTSISVAALMLEQAHDHLAIVVGCLTRLALATAIRTKENALSSGLNSASICASLAADSLVKPKPFPFVRPRHSKPYLIPVVLNIAR